MTVSAQIDNIGSMNYQQFLASKTAAVESTGFDIDRNAINTQLFPFQRDIVQWALSRGGAAVFAECGLGKSIMEWEWSQQVANHTGKQTLLLAPLGVAFQMIDESPRFGYEIDYCRSQAGADASNAPIIISNYEMAGEFDPSRFGGVALDESSILKSYTGKTKRLLMQMFKPYEFVLAATATPSPNDYLELGNHAEILGAVDKSADMIREYFINDTMKAGGYRLLKHAERHFWEWVSSWAVCLRKPSDIGDYDDSGYELAGIDWQRHVTAVDHSRAFNEMDKYGQRSLLVAGNTSATGLHREKRATMAERIQRAAEIANGVDDHIVLFVETNAEADALKAALPDAVEMRGSESIKTKREKLRAFRDGEIRHFITKPKMAAHGLNWQHCNKFAVVSVTHKFEQLYQLSKRFDRFGQTRQVTGHLIFSESEQGIVSNVDAKMTRHVEMQTKMIEAMQSSGMRLGASKIATNFVKGFDVAKGENWTLYNGDSVVTSRDIDTDSIDMSCYSPPFSNLYIYSDAFQDMGNSRDNAQFAQHYGYLIEDMARTHKLGAYSAVHCKDLPMYANRDGAMGLIDFPLEIIAEHRKHGWSLVDWITIWKDPVIEMQRTKNAGLLWSSAFCQRAERARQGMADYVLVFKNDDSAEIELDQSTAPIAEQVVGRIVDLWCNAGESISTPYHKATATKQWLIVEDCIVDGLPGVDIRHQLHDGRLLVCRVNLNQMTSSFIQDMAAERMVFHSRVALTDGTFLIAFRKWVNEMPTTHVTHDIAPDSHAFIGRIITPWRDDREYSINVWQRYASPAWFDLDGLPESHPSIWMDIDQTNVLNFKIARDPNDEKHICPLQLDLIARCVDWYSDEDDVVYTPFAGVGSELVESIKLGRNAVGGELKRGYWLTAQKHLREAERVQSMPTLFDLMTQPSFFVK